MKTFTFLTVCLLSFASAQYDKSQGPDICERNIQTCSIECSNQNSTAKTNTCDPDTLTFSCVCSNNFAFDPKKVTFPASFTACQIEGEKCQSACDGEVTCAQNCVTKYVCNAGPTNIAASNPDTKANGPQSNSSSKVPTIYTSEGSSLYTFVPFTMFVGISASFLFIN